jgi:phosphoglycerate dehydrogenase-like enzyme|tara:strand:+ start:874 stop:1815 length:942 start_codon:yes stop_codon:yes gene_type:complete
MVKSSNKIAVCSRSFSNNLVLKKELLKNYKNVIFNKSKILCGNELILFLKDADKAIIGLEKIDKKIIDSLPKLKVISKFGVGLNNIDIEYLKYRKIRLGWESGVNKRSVSELTLCLILNSIRKISFNQSDLHNKIWKQTIGSDLTNSTIGIIGCGNVGQDLIKLLKPFQCKIYVHDIKSYNKFYYKHNLTPTSLNFLLKKSDIISIHTPLNKSTIGLINNNNLKLLKPNSSLINTARGGIINEDDLYNFLKKNKFNSASDVFVNEPNINTKLLKLKNFFATPHIAGSTKESILKMGTSAIRGLNINTVPSEDL